MSDFTQIKKWKVTFGVWKVNVFVYKAPQVVNKDPKYIENIYKKGNLK